MSTQRQTTPISDLPDEDGVREYLRSNPDFFERNRQLLAALRLPHASGGGTVSLVERQVATLRQKNLKVERRLRELVDVARANDRLAEKIHRMTLDLIAAPGVGDILTVVESHLRRSFAADQSVTVLFRELWPEFADDGRRFLKVAARDADALKPFETFLGSGRARCGQIRDSQRDYLFGKDTDEIGSAALIPLGQQSAMGFVAIGSANAEHFHPAMSIDFLSRIGELVSGALERCRAR